MPEGLKSWRQGSRKEQPELVTGGPYAFVRHPIYTGIIVAILGSAIGETIVLQIKIQMRQDDVINRAMRSILDHLSLSGRQPVVEARTLRTEKRLQLWTDLPAHAAADEDEKLRHRTPLLLLPSPPLRGRGEKMR